jgi:hypothetical protein
MRITVAALAIGLFLAACGDGSDRSRATAGTSSTIVTSETETSDATQPVPASGCADVVGVEVERVTEGVYRFEVTVRSGDTGWDKYADAWEIRASDGTVLGVRALAHPHENEQPFTRSLSGVEIPTGVAEVTVAARDSVEGFCGATTTVAID